MDLLTVIEDIAHRLDAEGRSELLDEADDLQVAEEASVTLADRARAARGEMVVIRSAGQEVSGVVVASGADWILLDIWHNQRLVPLAAVETMVSVPGAVLETQRFPKSLRFVLREMRDQSVYISSRSSEASGVLRQVGSDYIEIEVDTSRDWVRDVATRFVPQTSMVLMPISAIVFLEARLA